MPPIFAKFALLLLITSTAAAPAFAAPAGATVAFSLAGGTLAGKYADRSINEAEETNAEQKGIKLKGSWYRVGGRYGSYGLDVEGRNYKPQDLAYWTSRNEFNFTLSYRWSGFPWLLPIFGYHSTKQSGNKDDPLGPPAFLDKNEAFILGLRTSFVPLSTASGHGLIVQGQFAYLTSFEKTKNFGTDSELKLGYVYSAGRVQLGIVGGQIRSFFNASLPDKAVAEKYLHVRHVQITNVYGFFLQY